MTSEQTIEFGHLREKIDAGQRLTPEQSLRYTVLLVSVQRDLPHGPTELMKQQWAQAKFQQVGQQILAQLQKVLIAVIPGIVTGLLKK